MFADGRSLMNHRHSHTNISGRQFPCRECGKTFGSRSSQQIHMRIHTGKIGSDPESHYRIRNAVVLEVDLIPSLYMLR